MILFRSKFGQILTGFCLILGMAASSLATRAATPSLPLKSFMASCSSFDHRQFETSNQRAREQLLDSQLLRDRSLLFLWDPKLQAESLGRMLHHPDYGIGSVGGFAMTEIHPLVEASLSLHSQLLRLEAINRNKEGEIGDDSLDRKLRRLIESCKNILRIIDGAMETTYSDRLATSTVSAASILLISNPYYESPTSLLDRMNEDPPATP